MYLGVPVGVGRKKKEVFDCIKDRIWQRIQSWKSRALSKAGKELLIKSVAKSIPNYVMGLCLLPSKLCSSIERMLNAFWWSNNGDSRGMKWMRWSKLCRRKVDGGMGFKSLGNFNLALLGKQSWRILMNPDCLMSRILMAKYFWNKDFLDVPVQANGSFIWKSICASRRLIKEGGIIQVGDGHMIRVWSDPWLPDKGHFKVQMAMPAGLDDFMVSELISQDDRCWRREIVCELFEERDVDLILSIPISICNCHDMWC